MRVLLTGAFGNIGTSALQELLRQGHQVRCFARKSRQNERKARPYAGQIELAWGDIRQPADLAAAVEGQEAILHLAFVIPPRCDEQPDVARQINVDGTRHLLEAARRLAHPPRILFASSFVVFGYTQDQPPPRKATDPVQATDRYSEHKLAVEDMIRASGLTWAIFRFADVPPLTMRRPHPIMYRPPLNTRIEVLHPHDAGLALANALTCDAVWGKVSLIGGGPRCQITYGEYLGRMLGIMGLDMPPKDAFCTRPFYTDWLDTAESQRLLQYQRATFEDILHQLQHSFGYKRYLLRPLRPLAHWWLTRLSPYRKP